MKYDGQLKFTTYTRFGFTDFIGINYLTDTKMYHFVLFCPSYFKNLFRKLPNMFLIFLIYSNMHLYAVMTKYVKICKIKFLIWSPDVMKHICYSLEFFYDLSKKICKNYKSSALLITIQRAAGCMLKSRRFPTPD